MLLQRSGTLEVELLRRVGPCKMVLPIRAEPDLAWRAWRAASVGLAKSVCTAVKNNAWWGGMAVEIRACCRCMANEIKARPSCTTEEIWAWLGRAAAGISALCRYRRQESRARPQCTVVGNRAWQGGLTVETWAGYRCIIAENGACHISQAVGIRAFCTCVALENRARLVCTGSKNRTWWGGMAMEIRT